MSIEHCCNVMDIVTMASRRSVQTLHAHLVCYARHLNPFQLKLFLHYFNTSFHSTPNNNYITLKVMGSVLQLSNKKNYCYKQKQHNRKPFCSNGFTIRPTTNLVTSPTSQDPYKQAQHLPLEKHKPTWP